MRNERTIGRETTGRNTLVPARSDMVQNNPVHCACPYLGQKPAPWSPGPLHGMSVSRLVQIRFSSTCTRLFGSRGPLLSVVLLKSCPCLSPLQDSPILLGVYKRRTWLWGCCWCRSALSVSCCCSGCVVAFTIDCSHSSRCDRSRRIHVLHGLHKVRMAQRLCGGDWRRCCRSRNSPRGCTGSVGTVARGWWGSCR